MKNPLFPDDTTNDDDAAQKQPPAYVLRGRENVVQPLSDDEKAQIGANPAADLIREKLSRLYASEPDALAEEREAEIITPRSKHQQFMYDLSTSGQSLADIQTHWHEYYVNLPDDEKHQVWQEFYENNVPHEQPQLNEPAPHKAKAIITGQAEKAQTERDAIRSGGDGAPKKPQRLRDSRTPDEVRRAIRGHVAAGAAKVPPHVRHHINSLVFGLSVGFIVLAIFLFGLFNEVIIAPFIQPGRTSAAPVIVSSASVDASVPSVIIPKINVQIPVVYNVTSNAEDAIQSGLNNGVVHYPTTVKPGQIGNTAFFGHSSNNIFNKGKYKFAFVLLHKLQVGDTFYLTYGGVVYGYKVIDTKVVSPSQVNVLNSIPGENATASLITCDPPGTTLNRLVVIGRQVSPDPGGNAVATSTDATATTTNNELPGNGPTLWTRIWRAIF